MELLEVRQVLQAEEGLDRSLQETWSISPHLSTLPRPLHHRQTSPTACRAPPHLSQSLLAPGLHLPLQGQEATAAPPSCDGALNFFFSGVPFGNFFLFLAYLLAYLIVFRNFSASFSAFNKHSLTYTMFLFVMPLIQIERTFVMPRNNMDHQEETSCRKHPCILTRVMPRTRYSLLVVMLKK